MKKQLYQKIWKCTSLTQSIKKTNWNIRNDPWTRHTLSSKIEKEPQTQVRVNKTFSKCFKTTVGILQCDALSALLFRLFLAISLKNQDVNEEILSQPKYADYITYGDIYRNNYNSNYNNSNKKKWSDRDAEKKIIYA